MGDVGPRVRVCIFCCLVVFSAAFSFQPCLSKTTATVTRAKYLHFYTMRSYQNLHILLKMNRQYCAWFSILFIHYLSAVCERQRTDIWGVTTVFSALKRVWKLLFSRYLADQVHTLARFYMIKNQRHPDQNHYCRPQTPQLKPPWVCSIGAHSCCQNGKIRRNSARLAQIVPHGNS